MLHDLVTWSFSAWHHNTLPLTLRWLLRTNARIVTSSSGVYLASVVTFHVITKGWSIGFLVPPSSIRRTVRVLLWDLIGATKSLSEGLAKPPPWFIVIVELLHQDKLAWDLALTFLLKYSNWWGLILGQNDMVSNEVFLLLQTLLWQY